MKRLICHNFVGGAALALMLGGCLDTRTPQKLSTVKARTPRQEIQPLQTWSGEIPKTVVLTLKSPHCITDAQEWAAVWKQFHRTDALPPVDFQKHLVLVAIGMDSSKVNLEITLDCGGELYCATHSTPGEAVNPQTCSYTFALLPREGIQSFESAALATPLSRGTPE